jgi:hypothetical protein
MRVSTVKTIAAITVITGLAFCPEGILANSNERSIQHYVDSLFDGVATEYTDPEIGPTLDSASISIDTIGLWVGRSTFEAFYVGYQADGCFEGKAILYESGGNDFEPLYIYMNYCAEVFLKPADIIEVDSVSVLLTISRLTGTGGCVEEKYWVWSEEHDRPVDLKQNEVTSDALMQTLPEGYYIAWGGLFDIESLSLESYVRRPGDNNCCPTGGWITLKYEIDGSSLRVISCTYDPDKIDTGHDSKQ